MPPVLIVHAENHMPWVSGPITSATNLQVKLKKGVEPKGVVRKPDGRPAANIPVYLATPFGHTRIENFGVENTSQKAITDADGRFAFPAQAGAVSVMIFDEVGFSETRIDELLKTGEVRLRPLAKVEGQLMVGATPGTNEVIYLSTSPAPYHWYPLELPAYSITFTARTDTNGKFVFDRAPPTLMEIAHSPTVTIPTTSGDLPAAAPAGAFRLTQTQRILPKPGETLRVALGGQGRVVTGRIEMAGGALVDWRGSPVTMENIVPHHGPSDAAMKSLTEKLQQTRRPGFTKAQRDAAEEAYNAERRSLALATQKYFTGDEGMAAVMASRRYFLQFDSEGNFRVKDIPPGKYRMTGWLSNPDPAAFATLRRMIAPVDVEITVQDGKTPLDLGVIKVTPPQTSK
jgi:hypothetical protein